MFGNYKDIGGNELSCLWMQQIVNNFVFVRGINHYSFH